MEARPKPLSKALAMTNKMGMLKHNRQYCSNLFLPLLVGLPPLKMDRITIHSSYAKHVENMKEQVTANCSSTPCSVQTNMKSLNGVKKNARAKIMSLHCKHRMMDRTMSDSVG